jgi:hypothetical protein
LAKQFVWEKLSKKVQFLHLDNDDMMKRCMWWHRSTWTTMPMSSLLSGLKLSCIANYQKWDDLAEEQICCGNQESSHSQ